MAVDTRDKRGSVLGWGLASLLILPAPGVIDQPDRQQVASSYRGITAQPSEAADGEIFLVSTEDRTFVVLAEDRTVAVSAEIVPIVVPVRPTP